MLDELGSYRLSDFLLFSQETYYRLFELYNHERWPVHVLATAVGLVVLFLLRRRRDCKSLRTAMGLLALVWAWVAWAFHLDRYAAINIAAPYFAALFGIEAVLLLLIGTAGGRLRMDTATAPGAGTVLFVYAVVIHPLTGLLAGRSWTQLSFFGMGPDPTAIATLGALLLVGGRLRWALLVPVVLWCLIGTLTAYTLHSVEAVAPAMTALAAVLLSFRRSKSQNVSS